MSVRRRVALELGALVVSATLFLALVPQRPIFLDVGLALLGLGPLEQRNRAAPSIISRMGRVSDDAPGRSVKR